MIVKAIILALWIIEALSFGKQDAFLYHNRMHSSNPDKENIHYLFSIDRFVILALGTWVHWLYHSWLSTGVFSLSLLFLFSYFHNGNYYRVRNLLDNKVYPKGWFDTSTTSEATFEFNVVSRTFLAITGAIGIWASITIG